MSIRIRSTPYWLLATGLLLAMPLGARAGGPRTVAGTSYFDPGVKGIPLTWGQGLINYYTDRGNLSPILPGANADAFVGDAFSRWTSISTAAISAVRSGTLAEDISGVTMSVSGGSITVPADIRPSATSFPVAIVYDIDGSVTNAQSGLCLDVTGASTSNGALVELWTCKGSANQKWARQ